jgi:DNA topoisomerase-6 subunit B
MTSFQSTLGEDEGMAAELAESQRAISIAEFFEKNKQMLGFNSGARGLVTAVKEAVDNALDATEEAGHLPDIYVEIEEVGDYYRVVVEDNGPGITKAQIPKIFGKLLYGSRFHKREQSLLPDQEVLVRRNGRVELVDIGTLCDAYLPDGDGSGTVRVHDDVEAPCFDRDTGEVTWQPVTHAIRHETDEETYRIETSRGRSIEVTGNHSLFGLDATDGVVEVEAEDLCVGDTVVGPERIPTPDDCDSVNLLEWIPRSALDDRDWYVYGIDRDRLERIRSDGERVRKPATEGGRDRTYFRYDGVDIMKDGLEQNYLEKGYLPADVVVDLGWTEAVSEGSIRTYQVGGEPSDVPVELELTDELMRFLGLYVAEGHADQRQVGFTFGSHETEYVEEVQAIATRAFGASTTVEKRERNSTRVKAFTSPLAVFLESVCGDGARQKHVPPFVFRAAPSLQQAFIDALHDGDGSDSHPSNQLSYATTSERLARELSYLWTMQGVSASWKEKTNESNISGGRTESYVLEVYGEDVDSSIRYDSDSARTARYRRLPTSVVEEFAVDDCPAETVEPTEAGVLFAAGLGSQLTYAKRFKHRIEYALAGNVPTDDPYRRTLESYGLLTTDGEPTEELRALWDAAERLATFGESDLCLLDVTNVERVDAPEYVYDVSVPGTGADENFVAGNQGALSVKNSRGQQGIGISAAVLYSQLTSGKPARVTSRTQGSDTAQYFELVIDTDTNEPEIREESTTSWDRPHGTRIELEMEGNMRARQQLHDYVKHTAVVNPHARVELKEPQEHLKFERATDELPEETEEIKPHPHGVELGNVLKMLDGTNSQTVSGFLQTEFTRVGKKTAESIIDAFRDRHYGREVSLTPPASHEDGDVARAVSAAVSNKGAEATAAFADAVAERVQGMDRVAHQHVVRFVDEEAERVADEHDKTFGETVRENAVEAAWRAVTSFDPDDPDQGASKHLIADVFALADEATSTRKDDETIRAFSERLAAKFVPEVGDADAWRGRCTREAVRDFVDRAADMTEEREDATFGDTARENVTEALWRTMRTVPDDPPLVSDLVGDRDAGNRLVQGMRETDIIAPPTSCLSPISADLVEAGLRKEYDAEFYASSSRDADVHAGDPFIAEAGIAYGGDIEAEGQADLLRYANRVPLVYKRGGCAITGTIKGIGWRNYNLKQPGGSGIPNGPVVLMVHVASTNVPFTSESKDAVASVEAIEDEIELAVREAARELKSYLNKQQSMRKRKKKQNVLAEVLPVMASKVADVTGRDEPEFGDALARIMNNVLVEREVEAEGTEQTVTVVVENHSDRTESPEVTDIVDSEPGAVSDGANVVEMDGEWFVKWSPDVPAGEDARLSYTVETDASLDLSVSAVEEPKLTVSD